MTKVTVDAATRTKLKGLGELLELCDESGCTIGYFHPTMHTLGCEEVKVLSPHTDEEIEELRKQRGGRPLADILKDLEKIGPQ